MTRRNEDIHEIMERDYPHGFVTDVETDTFPPGLDESIIRQLSLIKKEPDFMLEWRLTAFRHWQTLSEPQWASVHYPPVDFQSISYYSAPKQKKGPKSLDEVDPEVLRTYEKLGIPLLEQQMLAGVAVDAVFDSVSVATTFKAKLAEKGIIFCPISEALQTHPDLVKNIYVQ